LLTIAGVWVGKSWVCLFRTPISCHCVWPVFPNLERGALEVNVLSVAVVGVVTGDAIVDPGLSFGGQEGRPLKWNDAWISRRGADLGAVSVVGDEKLRGDGIDGRSRMALGFALRFGLGLGLRFGLRLRLRLGLRFGLGLGVGHGGGVGAAEEGR